MTDAIINSIKQCASPEVFNTMSSDIAKLESLFTVSSGSQTWLSNSVFCIVKNIVKLSAQFNVMCVVNAVNSQDASSGCDMIETGVSGMFADGSGSGSTLYDRELLMVNQVLTIYKEPLQRMVDLFIDANNFFIQECSKSRNPAEKAKLALFNSIVKNLRYVLRINKSTNQTCDNTVELVQAEQLPSEEAELINGVVSLLTQSLAEYAEFAKCVGEDIANEFVSHFLYVTLVVGDSGGSTSGINHESMLNVLINNKTLLHPITRISKILGAVDKTCMIKFIYSLESFGGSGSGSNPTQQICQMYDAVVGSDVISSDYTALESLVFIDQILKKYRSVLRNIISIIMNDALDLVKSNTCNDLTNRRISLFVTSIDSLRSIMQGRGVIPRISQNIIETFDNPSSGWISSHRYLIIAVVVLIIIYLMGGFSGNSDYISLSVTSASL